MNILKYILIVMLTAMVTDSYAQSSKMEHFIKKDSCAFMKVENTTLQPDFCNFIKADMQVATDLKTGKSAKAVHLYNSVIGHNGAGFIDFDEIDEVISYAEKLNEMKQESATTETEIIYFTRDATQLKLGTVGKNCKWEIAIQLKGDDSNYVMDTNDFSQFIQMLRNAKTM